MKHQCFACDQPATLINHTQFAGTHYWCEACVPLDDKPDCVPLMKTTHRIAYNYCMALIQQRAGETQLNTAFLALGSDNQIFGLAEHVEGAYTELVHELLGETLFDWLMWWMYETDCGKSSMEFTVDGVEYDPTTMTLYRFLEIVDAQ